MQCRAWGFTCRLGYRHIIHHWHAEPTQLTQYRSTAMHVILRNCVWFLAVVCLGFLAA